MLKSKGRMDSWNEKLKEKRESSHTLKLKSGTRQPETNYYFRIYDGSRGKFIDLQSDSFIKLAVANNTNRGFIKRSALEKIRLKLLDFILLGGKPPYNMDVLFSDFPQIYVLNQAKYEEERIRNFIEPSKMTRFQVKKG